MTARGAYREILAIRDARRLISASAVSQLGDWLFNAALLGTGAVVADAALSQTFTLCFKHPDRRRSPYRSVE